MLCACPVKLDRDLLKTDLNVYVTWGGEALPAFNPYIYIPAPPAEAVSSKTVMRIVLPSVFGGALMLLAVLVYVQYQRNLANYGWVLKEDELEFDEPEVVLGQGAQGKDFALARPPPQGLTVVADPSVAKFEGRCVAMLADLLHAEGKGPDAAGAASIGSSEAIMLGGLAMKLKWRERRQAKQD